ncbi:MAG: hypothetical protein WCA78_03230 [Rhizomicrobium sp.]
MTDQDDLARRILSLPQEKKVWFLSRVILELTFQARSSYSDNRTDGASIMRSVEAIHRICGYSLLLLENKPLESEALLAEMVTTLVHNDKRMQKALEEI